MKVPCNTGILLIQRSLPLRAWKIFLGCSAYWVFIFCLCISSLKTSHDLESFLWFLLHIFTAAKSIQAGNMWRWVSMQASLSFSLDPALSTLHISRNLRREPEYKYPVYEGTAEEMWVHVLEEGKFERGVIVSSHVSGFQLTPWREIFCGFATCTELSFSMQSSDECFDCFWQFLVFSFLCSWVFIFLFFGLWV